MSTPTTPAPAPRRRRLRKRHVIPLAILGFMLLVGIWVYWRGTASESVIRNPDTSSEGPITQLVTQEGRTFLRCAIVVDHPPEVVWKVIHDYDSQADFLPYLSQIESKPQDDGRIRITGVAHSHIWGDWPFESHVRENADPEKGKYVISWDERNAGEFVVNHGSWQLDDWGKGRSLLVYSLQVEMANAPDFLVRAVMRSRLDGVLLAVRNEIDRRNPR